MHEGRVEQVDDARPQQRVGLSRVSRGEQVVQGRHERLAGELILQHGVVHVGGGYLLRMDAELSA